TDDVERTGADIQLVQQRLLAARNLAGGVQFLLTAVTAGGRVGGIVVLADHVRPPSQRYRRAYAPNACRRPFVVPHRDRKGTGWTTSWISPPAPPTDVSPGTRRAGRGPCSCRG